MLCRSMGRVTRRNREQDRVEGLAKPGLVFVMSFEYEIHIFDVIIRTEAVHYNYVQASYKLSHVLY